MIFTILEDMWMTILIINQGNEQRILNTFNNLCPDIHYSMELDKNRSINFLDMKLTYCNNIISTSIYKKPTHTGTFWNYSSQHHFSQKVGLVKTLIYRTFAFIDDMVKRNEEVSSIKEDLIKEDFPIKLIDNIIEDMSEKHENNTLIQNLKCKNQETSFITLFARNFTNILKKYEKIKIAWKPCNTISQYINKHKNTQLTKRADTEGGVIAILDVELGTINQKLKGHENDILSMSWGTSSPSFS
ncbi:hypothetical protein LAZ67_20001672, partial [Cordylochernes scorpioides]